MRDKKENRTINKGKRSLLVNLPIPNSLIILLQYLSKVYFNIKLISC